MAKQTAPDSFGEWLSGRPKWLQTAAARLVSSGRMPNQDELGALADLCLAEAGLGGEHTFEAMPHGYFSQPLGADELRIRKVHKVVGVNAIKNDAVIDFGDASLAVVFGSNGAGKSGFARLLKHACGARHKTDLLPNVFLESVPTPSAEIIVSKGGSSESLLWSSNAKPLAELRHAHVFDSLTAHGYVNEKNESTYEPRRMRFISALITICDQVSAEIQNRKKRIVSEMPSIPGEFSDTGSYSWFKAINYRTSEKGVSAATSLLADESEEMTSLEGALKQSDIEQRTRNISQQIKNLGALRKEFNDTVDALSDQRLDAIASARDDASAKRKAADEDAAKVFANLPLDGVGHQSWRLMWEQARAYSEGHAYPTNEFPFIDEGARCVLCQQELDLPARQRIDGFERFILAALETSAQEAEECVDRLLSALPTLPGENDWKLKMAFVGLDESAQFSILDAFQKRRMFALTSDHELKVDIGTEVLTVVMDATEQRLLSEERLLVELQQQGKREEKLRRLGELKAKQWLHQQKESILKEIGRLVTLKKYADAESLCRTNSLTAKKNELATEELARGYKDRFQSELDRLGGTRIPVEPVSQSGGKGRINFELRLRGAKRPVPAHVVLSEGECRIVALAAFIADMQALDMSTPFVFDDPISSLDQDFEERVVERLVELSKSRQVIVFTHRLSLLTLLDEAVDRHVKRASAANRKADTSFGVTALRAIGTQKGLVTELALRDRHPKNALSAILNNHIPPLRKEFDAGNVAAFDDRAKALCSEFRSLLEQTVERVLLGEVVKRFRRSVTTMNRITALAKIRMPDCEFIDQLMTKYSAYEHSQPVDVTVGLPTPDELQSDVQDVLSWINEFEKRVA